jgi:hypothetical protein
MSHLGDCPHLPPQAAPSATISPRAVSSRQLPSTSTPWESSNGRPRHQWPSLTRPPHPSMPRNGCLKARHPLSLLAGHRLPTPPNSPYKREPPPPVLPAPFSPSLQACAPLPLSSTSATASSSLLSCHTFAQAPVRPTMGSPCSPLPFHPHR